MGLLESTLINPLTTRKISYYFYGVILGATFFVWLTWDIDTTLFDFEIRSKETASWIYYQWGGKLWYKLYMYSMSSYFLNKVAIGAIIGALSAYLFIRTVVIRQTEKRTIRGGEIVEPEKLKKKMKGNINIYAGKQNVPIPEHDERRSFLIVGKAGSGKTQAILHFYEQIIKANHSAVVYDRKPDFWHRYYRPEKDVLFYPKDKRCVRWNIFSDIRNEDDVEFAAWSIIPENLQAKDPYWDNASRDVLKVILFYLLERKTPNNKTLMDFLRRGVSPDKLYKELSHTANQKGINIEYHLLTKETSKNVLSTLYTKTNGLIRRELYYEDGDFSVRDWIREIDVNPGRSLYLVMTAAEGNAYQTFFRLIIEIMIREILSLPENSMRRVWLLLDEFQTLGKLSQMEEGLALWRSFGGTALVGTQSLAKVEELYGKQGLRSLYQNLSTRLIFQYDEADGAKFISDNFGEGEVVENQHNRMITRSGDRDISQVQERITVKKLLLPGELSQLQPLECYLKVSEYPLTKISYNYKNPQQKHTLQTWELPNFNLYDEKRNQEETKDKDTRDPQEEEKLEHSNKFVQSENQQEEEKLEQDRNDATIADQIYRFT